MDVPYDLNKVKKGDKNAFRSFFGYFYPKLMALACRFVDSQVAEDLVQDVFASYWEKKHLIEADDIHSFLFKWLQNSCLNHTKSGYALPKPVWKQWGNLKNRVRC